MRIFWNTHTHTHTADKHRSAEALDQRDGGTQFTCFASKKVDVLNYHLKYSVFGAPIFTAGPFHSSFPHSHGNMSVHLSLSRHTASISSPFLHFISVPVHCHVPSFCYSLPSFYTHLTNIRTSLWASFRRPYTRPSTTQCQLCKSEPRASQGKQTLNTIESFLKLSHVHTNM